MMKVSSAFYFFCSNKMRGLAFSSIALVFFIVLFGGWLAAEEIVGIEKSLAETGKQVFKSDSVFVEADSFESAESKFQAGDDVNAKLYYQKYLNTGLGKKYVDRAIFRLAQIDFRSRYYVTALRYLNYLVEKFPDTPRLMKAKFMMGVCHFEMDHVGAARRIFENQLKFNPDVGARWKSIYYLSRLDEKNLDYIQAIGKLRKVYQKSPDRDTRIEAARIGQSIIEKKISAVDLKALIKKFKTGFPVDLALWRLISLYRIQRDNDNYLSALQQFLELFPNHQYRSEAEKFLGQAHNKKSFTYKLGAILPLTGKHALTGQKVLQGVQLAFNQLPPGDRASIQLEVKDSGTAGSLLQATEELAADPNVLGIIGPVLSKRVKEVLSLASDYELPMFTPTASTPGLAEVSPFIFRNALTRDMQARFLARYAMNELNLKRFAILYPNEAFGEELRLAFAEEVRSLGAEIIVNVSYDRRQTDFKKQILDIGGISDKQLKKLVLEKILAQKEAKLEKYKSGVPFSRPVVEKGVWNEGDVEGLKVSLDLSYDAIFIPDFYDKVGLIVPQLAFYNLDRVTLLGVNGWNHPDLLKSAGRFLNNRGVFVDGFFKDSKDSLVQTFVRDFEATFGEEPSIFSAQAYDTTRMYLDLILQGVDNRFQMHSRLMTVKNFPGVSGESFILPNGETVKTLFALKIKRKKIVQIN